MRSKLWQASTTLILVLLAAPFLQAGQFVDAPQYATGGTPSQANVADFNGDGNPDLLVASAVGRTSLLLGNGNGSFGAPLDVSAPVDGSTVGDFNQDGKIDIAVSNATSSQIYIFLGNGDGTFQAAPASFAARRPSAIVTADLNHDGKLDLIAVGNAGQLQTYVVNVLLGNGDGTFQAHSEYATATGPVNLQTADLNGDGNLDVVTVSSIINGRVSVLLGNGDGTLQAHRDFASGGSNPRTIAVADFNNDGKIDLAIDNAANSSVSVLLGNGDGTFQLNVGFTVGKTPNAVVAADFNGDGNVDIAATNASDYTVSVLFGNGTGTFKPHVDYGAGVGCVSLVTGDFNKDGIVDLAVPDQGTAGDKKNISILLGNGTGGFRARRDYFIFDTAPASVASADFNGDGRADLVVGSELFTSVSILLANPNGTFGNAVEHSTAQVSATVATGDFNHDGKMDVVSGTNGAANGIVSVLFGNGNGSFRNHIDTAITLHPTAIAVGDFNKDGNLDVAISEFFASNGDIAVLLGKGDGTFQSPVTYNLGQKPGPIATGDVNGDGKLDIVSTYGNFVSVLLGNGDGTFQPQLDSNAGATVYGIAVGDMNEDSKIDAVVSVNGNVGVMSGNGDGTFQSPISFPAGQGPANLVLSDFNKDGHLDVAVVNGNAFGVSYLRGNGNGTLQPHQDYAAGMYPMGIAAGDFNADGFLDLAVPDSGAGFGHTVSTYLNTKSAQ